MPQASDQIRIFIVDDHPVVRAGLTSMLGTQQEIEVVATASSGDAAIEALETTVADVMLLDLRMPGLSGVKTIQEIRRSGHPIRIIVLTSFETDEDIFRAIQSGAQGYLLKDTSLKEMIEAIKTVHAGKRYIPRDIAARLAERMMRTELTPRELEILRMLAKGLTNKQIGKVLNISNNTVKNHVNSVIEKLEVCDRTEAATTAIQRGIISADE
jgi:DNA-binding NarL/FixJ family response regulator